MEAVFSFFREVAVVAAPLVADNRGPVAAIAALMAACAVAAAVAAWSHRRANPSKMASALWYVAAAAGTAWFAVAAWTASVATLEDLVYRGLIVAAAALVVALVGQALDPWVDRALARFAPGPVAAERRVAPAALRSQRLVPAVVPVQSAQARRAGAVRHSRPVGSRCR